MDIVRIDTSNKRDVRRFLDFPFRLYRGTPQWVPPFASDAQRMLDRRRHPFYTHSDADFFIALKNGRVVGRLAILDNRHYNAFNQTRTALFYLFEAENDRAISRGLFNAASDWARARGLTELFGPKGFTALDGIGLLVKGLPDRAPLGTPSTPGCYPEMLDDAGINMELAERLVLPVDASRIGAYGPNVSALREFVRSARQPG